MAKYTILCPTGIDYPDSQAPGSEKHVSAGDVVDDLPTTFIKDGLAQGLIAKVSETQAEKEAK